MNHFLNTLITLETSGGRLNKSHPSSHWQVLPPGKKCNGMIPDPLYVYTESCDNSNDCFPVTVITKKYITKLQNVQLWYSLHIKYN